MDQLLEGLPVMWIAEGSVAARAGVKRGDRLLIANGVAMAGFDSYAEARGRDSEKLEMTVQRGNQILDFTLVFDRPDSAVDAPDATAGALASRRSS